MNEKQQEAAVTALDQYMHEQFSESWQLDILQGAVNVVADALARQGTSMPSDEQISSMAHRTCMKYVHSDSPDLRQYTFGKLTLRQFARALLDSYAAPADTSNPLPRPSVHAAAHYAGFLRRHSYGFDQPKRGAIENAAVMIDLLHQETRRLHQELIDAQEDQ